MISRDGCHNNQECRCKIVKQGRGSPVFSEEPHSLGDFVVGASATAHHNVPGGYGGIEERLCLSQIPSNLRTWGLRIFHNLRLSTLGVLPVLVGALSSLFRARAALQLENLALRHQIGVLQRSVKKRPKLTAADRILWAWLCGVWSEVAICFGDRQAGNGCRLASERLSPFLDMEDPTRPGGTASSSKRGPRSDPQNESRESALGCSPHSRRTAQTGHRHRPDQRGQVHGPPPQAAFADLAEGVGECQCVTKQRRIDPA